MYKHIHNTMYIIGFTAYKYYKDQKKGGYSNINGYCHRQNSLRQ